MKKKHLRYLFALCLVFVSSVFLREWREERGFFILSLLLLFCFPVEKIFSLEVYYWASSVTTVANPAHTIYFSIPLSRKNF